MTELFFLRHGLRADQAPLNDPPLASPYKVYDPLVTVSAVGEADAVAAQMVLLADFAAQKKNVYVHFSPYLRCCQTADLLVTALMRQVEAAHPDAKPKFHLLADFALSEWIHDKMKNKPPFVDSTEAYQMYTPNVQHMTNRKLMLNFRPTTQLGPWNEHELLYKDYLERCKQYFQKLLATYDKPGHDNDTIVVVSHGYAINNFLSYFVNHPVFEEIPEFALNFAVKEDGTWTLRSDCLGVLEKNPGTGGVLNLESDIVYYKTNFIKKDEYDENKQFPTMGFGGLRKTNSEPRASFKVEQNPARPPNNPLCPSASDWNPRDANKFKVKSEFLMKVMKDDAFKKAFDITNAPLNPVSPEVLPNSAPSRNNSTVNLLKLTSNEEIYHPFKLRYSLTSDIPVHYLNSKVNSHVSLANFGRSARSSSLDLPRNGMSIFPGALSGGLNSPRDHPLDVEMSPNMNEVISRLSRVRSLQKKRPQNSTPKFGVISENEGVPDRNFSLAFKSERSVPSREPTPETQQPKPVQTRPRRASSVKFVPSVISREDVKKSSIFYNPRSDSSSGDESSEEDKKYMWFGQNMSFDK